MQQPVPRLAVEQAVAAAALRRRLEAARDVPAFDLALLFVPLILVVFRRGCISLFLDQCNSLFLVWPWNR
eukprot:3609193-Prymnesium_polylepis.1